MEYQQIIQRFKEENKELIESGKCKKIFLENLPKRGKLISWKNSIGYKIYFIYENIEGFIEIIELNKDAINVIVEYKGTQYKISTPSLSDCRIGVILGKITKDFKIEIGTKFKDNRRDIVITDREYRLKEKINKQGYQSILNEKWYKYTCNVCGWTDGAIAESDLKEGKGCSCCYGRTAVLGINTIWDTDKWMYYLGISEEDAKTHTYRSSEKVKVTCPDCKTIEYKIISNIYKNKSISCTCSDKIPYGEKLTFSLFKQLGLIFKTQLNKSTFKWIGKYKYDFYFELNGEPFVTETHGLQHYEECTGNWKNKLKEQQKIDSIKKQLALDNGIKEENYIVIDCRKSELKWIRDNENGILNSRLNELFDLSTIDWVEVENFTLSNLVKIACEHKRNNSELTCNDIGTLMGYCDGTIRKWLKQGSLNKWCYYNADEELRKSTSKNGKSKGMPTGIFKEGILIGVFESSTDLTRQSEKLFGVKFIRSKITMVCNGKNKSHKGFTFKYLTQEEIEEFELRNINTEQTKTSY
jgi:hypothetical protein